MNKRKKNQTKKTGWGETETFREKSSNRNNGTGGVRQERRENSAVISR